MPPKQPRVRHDPEVYARLYKEFKGRPEERLAAIAKRLGVDKAAARASLKRAMGEIWYKKQFGARPRKTREAKEPTLAERKELVRLLNTCKTKREVAGKLGISYTSLLYRIEKYRVGQRVEYFLQT
jgi:transposase